MKLYTGKALGKALGLSLQEVESLRKAGVISRQRGSLYSLERAAAGIIQHYRQAQTQGQQQTGTVDYATERALLMRAKRMDQEYETRMKEGSLHEAKDVEMLVGGMLVNFRARVRGIPAKLAPMLAAESDNAKVFKMLTEAMDEALEELSDYDKLFGTGAGD